MRVFKRRDTRTWALTLGGFAGLSVLVLGLGTPLWSPWIQLPLALLVGGGVGGAICRWRRHLPPDVELHWIDPAEAQRLADAGPPADRTMLHVTFARDLWRRYRLDVLIDGVRVGQLRPGTGFLLPLRPGLRVMSAYLDRPASTVQETINSIPGGYAGYVVRNTGSRAIELSVRRDSALRPVIPKDVRLVRPAVPEA